MSLESVLERSANALERIATALETRLSLVTQPDQPAAEPESGKRGRKPRVEKVETPKEEAPSAAIPTAAPATASAAKSFLDEDEEEPAKPAGDPFDALDEKGQRDQIRKELIALQNQIGPEKALQVLIDNGECDTLKALQPANFKAVRAAVKKATPK